MKRAALPLLLLLLPSVPAAADVVASPADFQPIVVIGTVIERNVQHPACGRVSSGGWATFRVERRISGRVRAGTTIRVVLLCPEMIQPGQRFRLTLRDAAPPVGALSTRQVTVPRDGIPTFWERHRRRARQ